MRLGIIRPARMRYAIPVPIALLPLSFSYSTFYSGRPTHIIPTGIGFSYVCIFTRDHISIESSRCVLIL